jgi:hypothetical protein
VDWGGVIDAGEVVLGRGDGINRDGLQKEMELILSGTNCIFSM